MPWQEAIFTIGGIVYIIALLPTIFGPNKPNWKTALITASLLYLYSVCYLTLKLPISAVSIFVLASCWTVVFFQAYSQQRR